MIHFLVSKKIEMKKDINWYFDKKKYADCKKVVLKFDKWNYYNTNTILTDLKAFT